MKRISHILIPVVPLLAAAIISILYHPANVTHAQTGTVPPAPALTADDTEANRVELSWDTVDGAVRYELWRWVWEGGGWTLIDDALTATTYTDSDVEVGKTYTYAVRGLTAGGAASPWSDYMSEEATATVAAPPDGEAAQAVDLQEAAPTATPTATSPPAPTATATPTATPTATATPAAAPTATATSPPALKAADAAAPVQAAQETPPSALAVTPTLSPAPAEEASEDDSVGRGGSESSFNYRKCTIDKATYEALPSYPTAVPTVPGRPAADATATAVVATATAVVATATAVAVVATVDAQLNTNCETPGRRE